MGVFGGLNLGGVDIGSAFNMGKIASGVFTFSVALVMFLIVGGITFFVLTKLKRKKNIKKIDWFKELGGRMIPVDYDEAEELIIPGTNIPVFYVRKKDLYMPQPVRMIGKDRYWLCIRNNREIVNFTLTNLNKEMKKAGLDYDHTDMRYAHSNLAELIKRNYRDKSVPWWREYKDVIALVVLIFVLTLSFFFIISKTGALIDKVGLLLDRSATIIEKLDFLIKSAENSGIKVT